MDVSVVQALLTEIRDAATRQAQQHADHEVLQNTIYTLSERVNILDRELKRAKGMYDELDAQAEAEMSAYFRVDRFRRLASTEVFRLTGLYDMDVVDAFYEWANYACGGKADGSSPPAFSHITFHFRGLTACGFVSCLVLNLYRASTEPVENKCTRPKKRSLGGKDALLLTLVILRTGMTQKVAGALFGVHESTVTNYFTTWTSFLAELFKRQQPYPSQQRVQKVHPVGYMRVFGHDRVRIMVDSSNVDTNAPSDADASGGLFSRYYSGNYAAAAVHYLHSSHMVQCIHVSDRFI